MKSKDSFLEWLRSLPQDTVFCDGARALTCPIARFTGMITFGNSFIDPPWMNKFVVAFDKNLSTTVQEAIQIAEDL